MIGVWDDDFEATRIDKEGKGDRTISDVAATDVASSDEY